MNPLGTRKNPCPRWYSNPRPSWFESHLGPRFFRVPSGFICNTLCLPENYGLSLSTAQETIKTTSHPTERLSQFVDYHLQPLVHKLPSFVKDTNDFLNKLLTIGNLPPNSWLVTLDVSSLYTNIPHNEGINACECFLRTSSHKTIPTSTLCDLIRMILTMNNFSFNDNRHLQIHGTAMGTKMAPSYASLFLGFFEANTLKNAPFQPHIWLRYIDDILWSGPKVWIP